MQEREIMVHMLCSRKIFVIRTGVQTYELETFCVPNFGII